MSRRECRIYYSEYESLDDLEGKRLNILAPRLIVQPDQPILFELTLADIASITQHNAVLNAYSWKVNSSFAYKKSVLTNQSLELGQAYSLFDQGIVFGFLGFNYANYDYLSERELDFLMVRPSLERRNRKITYCRMGKRKSGL